MGSARHVLEVQLARREDGSWTATTPDLPGVAVSAETSEKALVEMHSVAQRRLGTVAGGDRVSRVDGGG